MIIPLQPKLRPKWDTVPQVDANGQPVLGADGKPVVYHVPVLDADGGQQLVPTSTFHQIPWPSGPDNSALVLKSYLSLSKGWDDVLNPVSGHIWFIKQHGAGDGSGTPEYLFDEGFTLKQDVRRWNWEGGFDSIPDDTDMISIQLDPHFHTVYATIEAKAK